MNIAFLLPSIATCHWKHNEYIFSALCNSSSAHIITDYVSVVIAICCVAIAVYWAARGKTFEGPVSLFFLARWPTYDANWRHRTSKPLWRKEKRWFKSLAMGDVARRKICMIILCLPRYVVGFTSPVLDNSQLVSVDNLLLCVKM
jgi:hypothetical protein